MQNVPKIANYQSAFSDAEFFGRVFGEKSLKDSSREKLLCNSFKERRDSQSKAIVTLPTNRTLKELFVKYNSAIPCRQQWNICFHLRRMRGSQKNLSSAMDILKCSFFFKWLCFNKTLFFVMPLSYSYYFCWRYLLVC